MSVIPVLLVEAGVIISGLAALASSVIGAYMSRRSVRKMRQLARKNTSVKKALLEVCKDGIITERERRTVVRKYLDAVGAQTPSDQISKLVNAKVVRILNRASVKHNDRIFIDLAREARNAGNEREPDIQKF